MPANQHKYPRSASDDVLPWWWTRKLSTREWTIAAVAAAFSVILILIISPIPTPRRLTNSNTYVDTEAASEWVPLTLLSKAQEKSAFCLDGSVPGYHIKRGFGAGSNSWLIHVEGGGWCNSIPSCSARRSTPLGSSVHMEQQVQFLGILSHDPLQNPGIRASFDMSMLQMFAMNLNQCGYSLFWTSSDFFNWNTVKIRYCDGSSFSSQPDSEFGNGTKLFFRGQLIWDTFMDELLLIGMSKAREALLTGCSAGGLATLIHCDAFRNLLPSANVKCLADAGFFPNEKDIAGNQAIKSFYYDVVHLQGITKSLNRDCVARSEPSECFFPQEFIKKIKTPVFLVQPAYDFWQIANILVPDKSDPTGRWRGCRLDIFRCDSNQLEVLHGYRNALIQMLRDFQQNPEGGMFVNSCFIHCQTWGAETWHSPTSPRINNKTVAEAVGDWYFKRAETKLIDCSFPCNPTCYHRDLSSLG